MKTLLIILGALSLLIILPIEGGLVLSVLWGWFIVPQFHLAGLGIAEAIGLSGVVGLLTYQIDSHKKTSGENTTYLVQSLVYPLIALLFGFIVHLFL